MGRKIGIGRRRFEPIPGTTIFDGAESRRGYALNKFCMSLNQASNRESFRADEDAYMQRFGLSSELRRMVKSRDFKGLMESGGNIYFVMKLGAATGHGLYTVGAMLRGQSLEEFLATRTAKGAR